MTVYEMTVKPKQIYSLIHLLNTVTHSTHLALHNVLREGGDIHIRLFIKLVLKV